MKNKTSRLGNFFLYLFSLTLGVAQSIMGTFTSYFGVIIGNTTSDQGILTSVRNVTGSVVIFWGYLADKYGRMPFLLLGVITMLSSSWLFIYFVKFPYQLLIIVFLQVLIAQAFYPAWNGFLGDISDQTNRGSLMGKVSAIGIAVSIFALLIIGSSMDSMTDAIDVQRIKFPFIIALIFFSFALVLLLFLYKFTIKKSERVIEKRNNDVIELLKKDSIFKRFLIISVIYQLSMSALWPIIPFVTLNVATNSPLGKWFTIAALWAIFNLPIAVLSVVAGILGDRFGRKVVIILSRFLLFTVPFTYLLALVSGDWLWLLICGFLGGIAVGGADINITALSIDMADNTDPSFKSTYNSTLMFVLGVTAFIGAIITGIIADFLISRGWSNKDTYIYLLAAITLIRFVAWIAHFWLKIPPKKEPMLQIT